MKSLRVDPSYLYQTHPKWSVQRISQDVVQKAKAAGFNTLNIYAYNSVYGSFYPTDYSLTHIEKDLGRKNIFNALVKESKKEGLKVVGSLPLNNFAKAWKQKSNWRVKTKAGKDYWPNKDTYLLSVANPEFLRWQKGFLQDFLERNPMVDAVDFIEPGLDLNWDRSTDFNPAMTASFKAKYPKQKLNSAKWLSYRAAKLTALIGSSCLQIKADARECIVVQTWPANAKGELLTSEAIRDGSGFDFNGILDLPQEMRPDYVIGELIWQQWKAEFQSEVFNPEWTRKVADSFERKVGGRSKAIIHVEASRFRGKNYEVLISAEDLMSTIEAVQGMGAGIDLYDFHQLLSHIGLQSAAVIAQIRI